MYKILDCSCSVKQLQDAFLTSQEVAAVPAPRATRSQQREVPSKASVPPAPAANAREELLKTKLDFARGGMVGDGKPSDSGDSSSPDGRGAGRRSNGAVDVERVAVDLKGVGLAQLLEEALAPAQAMWGNSEKLWEFPPFLG
eukprot:s1674_g8.t1